MSRSFPLCPRLVPPRPALAALALLSLAACGGSDLTQPQFDDPAEARRIAPPSAPQSPRATAGNAQATVTWVKPASGTGSLLGYTVTATPGGNTASVNASTLTATLTGLTNGTRYTFTVTARNLAGTGPASVPTNAVTPTAPAAPTPPPPTTTSGKWVTAYYVGYQRALYPETSVDFTYITHVALGAIQATATGGVTTDFFIDNTNGPIMARNLSTRAHAAGRKALLMLGGDGYRASLVSATSDAYRATFVRNLLATMDNLGYDGIDVDWEPLEESDKPQLLQLLRDLRTARPGMILTFPVGWTNANWGAASPWYAEVAQLVDQINIMSYSMADAWPGWTTWHHAALYGEGGDHPSSISSSITAFRGAGVPAARLGVGIGTYGSCWRGPTAPLQPVQSGWGVVASDNTMSYANIVAQYYSAAAYRWDATARMGYLSFATPTGPAGCTMVSYENPQSVTEKGAYVTSQGLGGAIVWTLQQGHIPTAAAGQRDPIVQAAYTAIVR